MRIGAKVVSHEFATMTIAPDQGPNAGQAKEFRSCKSFEGDPNFESKLLEGTSFQPVAIVVGAMKPDYKIELEAHDEMAEYAKFCGPGYGAMTHTISVVYDMPTPSGRKVRSFTLIQASIEKGWGAKSEANSAVSASLSGKAIDFQIDGVSPAPKGGSAGATLGGSQSVGGGALGISVDLSVSL